MAYTDEARLDDGPRAELHVLEERGGDGKHDGEYGAAHEEEALRPWRQQPGNVPGLGAGCNFPKF